MTERDDGSPLLRQELNEALRRRERLTALSLWLDALARAFWPLAVVMMSLGAAALLGLPLERAWSRWVLLGAGVSMVGLFCLGLWRLQRPRRGAARRALDATLPGRPIAAAFDAPAWPLDDPAALGLWQAHLRRQVDAARQARALPPRPGLALRDRFALRLIALTALTTGLIFGTAPGFQPFRTTPPGAAASPGAAWEGWITAPDYSGLPTRYLPDLSPGELEVLTGSRITISLIASDLGLRQNIGRDTGTPQEPQVRVDQSGALSITGDGGRAWEVTMRPDQTPRIGFDQPPQRGEGGLLQVSFAANDDFGVTEAEAVISLALGSVTRRYHLTSAPEPRDDLKLQLPLPVAGQRLDIANRLEADLSRHPFAHLPVRITLTATDAAGQQGASAAEIITLPGKRFYSPAASALIEQRQALLWHRDNAADAAMLLRALAATPDLIATETAALTLELLIERIERAAALEPMPRAVQDRLADGLWRLAERIEDGDLASALERLRHARERLSTAMQEGASPDEISELMRDYNEALEDWLDELARRAPKDDQPMPDQDGIPMGEADLQAMMDEIERLMNEGRIDEAMQLLEMLQEMLENMQVQQGGGDGSGAGEALDDTLREQQELSDDAFRDLQQRPGDQGGNSSTGEELAERQDELRRQLDGLRDALPPPGTEDGNTARGALDEAGDAMERAEEALRDGQLGDALTDQAEALRRMREARGALGGNARRATRAEDLGQGQPSRDPLGRDVGRGDGLQDGELGRALDPSERARELERLLSERLGQRDLDQSERGYLEELLERF